MVYTLAVVINLLLINILLKQQENTAMKIQFYSIIILLTINMAYGCSAPYYGYTRSEWDNLTEEKKAAIKDEYKIIIDSRNEQKHTDKINSRTQSVLESGVSRPDR